MAISQGGIVRMNLEILKDRIEKARGLKEVDQVFTNGKVVNVYTSEIEEVSIAVDQGVIVGLGDYKGREEIDLKGAYVIPGLIDSHVHIESSMTTPKAFAEVLAKHGVMTIIADPHEIANVKGMEGIEYMIEESKDLPVEMYFMLPSCVPSGDFETSGAILLAKDLEALIDHDRVLGLGEMMDFPGLLNGSDKVLEKILLAEDQIIDGHGPGLVGKDLNAYRLAGVLTDHECTNTEEMMDRLRRGMIVQIREGSATKNLEELLPAVNKENLSQILFCTDDRDPEDLVNEGSIDNNIRKAIRLGTDIIDAIKMATINTANTYGLKHKGAIAPGKEGTFFTVESLQEFEIKEVYQKGNRIVEEGELIEKIYDREKVGDLGNTVILPEISLKDLEIKITGEYANVMELVPFNITTNRLKEQVGEIGEVFIPNKDYSKVIVIERHHGTGNMAMGILKGYGITKGAVAQTIAHDSHNLICVGDNDEDMLMAIREIEKMGGGQVAISQGEILGEVALPVGGIMSDLAVEEVAEIQKNLFHAIEKLEISEEIAPFMTLGFMSLAVIPEVKLTDRGLFHIGEQKFLPLFE